MSNAVYRAEEVKPAETVYGAVLVRLIPTSPEATKAKLEVGDYVVLHKDNGPPEEIE